MPTYRCASKHRRKKVVNPSAPAPVRVVETQAPGRVVGCEGGFENTAPRALGGAPWVIEQAHIGLTNHAIEAWGEAVHPDMHHTAARAPHERLHGLAMRMVVVRQNAGPIGGRKAGTKV